MLGSSKVLAKKIQSLQKILLASIATVAISPLAVAQDVARSPISSLGKVDFETSCQANVQDDFNRAIAMLHHMQYEQSRAGFEDILAIDPNCAMAHWGIAMTLFQPLWPSRPSVDTLNQGLESIEKAQELGVARDRNTALVEATSAFFQEPETADWWTRIQRWHQGMETAFQSHPNDIETSVFFALSHLAVGTVEPNQLDYNARAAETLLAIYNREPMHPGAVHYTIHANDIDGRANESLDVVRSYGDIAPEVPHALHMPTHIFVRLGYWPETIEWNRRSADAALNFPAADGVSHHYPHALDYMVYAHLQQGDSDSASDVLQEISDKQEPFQGSFISAFHLAAMPARYAVERRAWEEALAIEPATPATIAWDRFFWAEAMSWFAKGLGAIHSNDRDLAQVAETRMAELRDLARESNEEAFATYIEIDRLILAAWRAHGDGEADAALELANEAVAVEASIQKHPVSPGSLFPAEESLGDLLLALDRPKEAFAAYEGSLAIWPGRFNSLVGAARAARAAGMEDKAIAYYEDLRDVSSNFNSNRSELAEALSFLED